MYVVWYIIVLLSRCGDKTLWFVGQAVKTPPSHGGIRGSIPLRTAIKQKPHVEVYVFFMQNKLLIFLKQYPANTKFTGPAVTSLQKIKT